MRLLWIGQSTVVEHERDQLELGEVQDELCRAVPCRELEEVFPFICDGRVSLGEILVA